MSDLKGRTIRLSEENWEWLDSQPGTMNEVIGSLRTVLRQPHSNSPAPDPRINELLELARRPDTRIDEILELMQSLPETIKEAFEGLSPSGPAPSLASIPGVQQGYAGLGKPRYESRTERLEREAADREKKARARSSVGDDPNYVFDSEFVQD